MAQRAKDVAYYEQATGQLASVRHPLLPVILDRFADNYYYMVQEYIDGESLDERLQKLLQPLPERDVLSYMNTLLNVLIAAQTAATRPCVIMISRQRISSSISVGEHC